MSKNRDLANYGTAALEDASVSATGDSVVKRDASGNVSAVDVYASGNVGVGVASASYPLHVVGSHTIYGAALESSSTSTTSYNVMRWIQGAGSGAPVGYIGTGGSATGNPGFAGAFGVGTQTANPVTFLTNDTERMRIDSSGNVLIGSSSTYASFSPTQLRLDGGYVNSATPTNQQLKLSLLSASATEAYGFTLDNTAGMWYHSGNSAGATGAHVFATAGAERLRIDSSGNVGIGTGSPSARLEVRNDVSAATDLDPTAIKLYNNSDGGSAIEFSNGVAGKSKISFGVTGTGGSTDDTYIAFSTGVNTALTERVRINSSGSFLHGITSFIDFASGSTAGFGAEIGGYVFASRDSANVMNLRRTGTGGSIIDFWKGGVSVPLGSLGVIGSALYFARNGQGGIKFGGLSVEPSDSNGNNIDNFIALGEPNNRWSVLYAGTGSINTSDAREKTPVEEFTADELNAAKQLSKEIGTYKFLSAVSKKGDDARKHIGMTVQRAIEIMEANNLDPFAYGFICYDAWEEKTVDHAAVEAVEGKEAWTETVEHEAEYDEDGEVIKEAWTEIIEHEAVEAVEAKDAYTEVVQEAGDRYSFRPDEMLFFIARGLEARIEALEG